MVNNIKILLIGSSSSLFTIYFYMLGIFQNNKVNFLKINVWDFPGGSDGKESTYNAGDLGLIPES